MKALVIGDLIIDVYHQGKVLGASVETSHFSASNVILDEVERVSPGGAGFLVQNMLALGGSVIFVTCVGNDKYGKEEKTLSGKRLKKIVLKDAKRITTVKERFWVGNKKVLKWDRLDNEFISPMLEKKILQVVAAHIRRADKLIVSDYRHGLITKSLARKLIGLAKAYKKPVYVDSQVAQSKSNHLWCRGADLFCLNVKEAKSIDQKFSEKDMQKSLARLQHMLQAKNIVLKLGEKGSASLLGENFILTPALKIRAVDPTGAGDAFFAVLALSKQITEKELKIANTWAGLKTALYGTQAPTLDILKKYTI
ncbi:MAG: hypothetical protein EXS48_00230 [Candidatus Staskawiczbacteria bacterium]|nr:hypothetical protein [Candidatus Staskawiczbacteria bacterium]